MDSYNSLSDFLCSINSYSLSSNIVDSFVKTWDKIHGYPALNDCKAFAPYPVIMVSVSGGSDSDIMLDMIERIGYPLSNLHYVFFDTGLEFSATKRHLEFLEHKYGITIERYKAKIPVPVGVKKYGLPFLSKKISNNIQRLQKHGFKWEDESFEELYVKYPRCKSALRWWCNRWGDHSKLNISNRKWLKEFMIANPPDFPISSGCCDGAKKGTSKMVEKIINPDLSIQGVRKAEGGIRSTAYTSCFDKVFGKADQFRPIFWFKKADKNTYEKIFEIVNSDCYCKYGLDRTGCACCPFGKNFEHELSVAEQYEPNLYKAAVHVFGKSYEYIRKYKQFIALKECANLSDYSSCEVIF